LAKEPKNQNIPEKIVEYGYKPDGKEIPSAYLSRITSWDRHRAAVVSPLQEDIMLKVNSQWSPLVPSSILSGVDTLAQTITLGGTSIITKATSRRMWRGSSPMRLSLKTRFEAVFDPVVEVVQPLRLLCSMALPAESKTEFLNKGLPFLNPPGPSPFLIDLEKENRSAKLKESAKIFNSFQGGDRIQIDIGEFLTFFNVIVTEVTPVVPLRFDSSGNPISATINVLFETYEMMTVESFQKSFKNNAVS
jgi:hypothetical protein